MIIVKIFRDNAENFKGITVANGWGEVIKQIKLYFSDHEKVKQRLIDGEIVHLPYFSLQKDRRVNNKKVKKERRSYRKEAILE